MKLQTELGELDLHGAGVRPQGQAPLWLTCVRERALWQTTKVSDADAECVLLKGPGLHSSSPFLNPQLSGDNSSGELGDGTKAEASFVPTRVAGGHLFKSIATLLNGPLSCALDASNEAWCWGDTPIVGNDAVREPTPMAPGFLFSTITLSGQICGIETATGKTLCWSVAAALPR